jgi:hypothetical protein
MRLEFILLGLCTSILADPAAPAFAAAQADCRERLLGGAADSQSFFLDASTVERFNQDDVGIELARSIVVGLTVRLGCAETEVVLDAGRSECGEIVPGEPISEACWLVSDELGYFFVTMDMLGGAHVIFNRWD